MTGEQNLLVSVSRERQIEIENICTQKNLTLSGLFEQMFEAYTLKLQEHTSVKDAEKEPIATFCRGEVEVVFESEPIKRGPGRPRHQ